MTATPDSRPLLKSAFAQATALVEAISPDQLDRPTACEEYDVQALIAHLHAVAERIAALPGGVDVSTMPLAVDDGGDFATRAERAITAWSDDDVLDRAMTVPWGTFPGFAVAGAYVMELVTHSWDLADATGRTGELDADLSEATLGIAQRALPADARDGFPFALPVGIPDGADAHSRLAAWMGRQPVAAA
jgi:uncharacterized protein (TIGR03086 family)